MSREHKPDTLTCDQCGHKETEPVWTWVSTRSIAEALTYDNPFWEEPDFCTAQCAAIWLLNYADKYEVLRPEVMELLGRR